MKKNIFSYLVINLFLTTCYSDPDFSLVPRIEYRSIKVGKYINKTTGSEEGDTVNIIIYFEDGDGDLGLNAGDTLGKFANYIFENGVRVLNKFRYNYFVTIFKKENNIFTKIPELSSDNSNFNGRFPKLNTLGSVTPLKGEISNTIPISYILDTRDLLEENDTLIFKVSIADRTLNLSNEIETEEIILGLE